jgi:hypothetical protein
MSTLEVNNLETYINVVHFIELLHQLKALRKEPCNYQKKDLITSITSSLLSLSYKCRDVLVTSSMKAILENMVTNQALQYQLECTDINSAESNSFETPAISSDCSNPYVESSNLSDSASCDTPLNNFVTNMSQITEIQNSPSSSPFPNIESLPEIECSPEIEESITADKDDDEEEVVLSNTVILYQETEEEKYITKRGRKTKKIKYF